MRIITLMTDFGLKDGNVGVMKGVIYTIAEEKKVEFTLQIVDISHLISPQNISEAALILYRSAPFFPGGTVHLVVVDPGVGTERRAIAGQIGNQCFVGPDNGILTLWLEHAERSGVSTRFVHLNRPEFWLPEVSHVFHGRDIFAPVAAHLATGTSLTMLGSPVSNLVKFSYPKPKKRGRIWYGEVIHIDHFGNISLNILKEDLEGGAIVTVSIVGVVINGVVQTFGDHPAGQVIALFGSTGNLLVSIVNGNAANQLKAKIGDTVEVSLED